MARCRYDNAPFYYILHPCHTLLLYVKIILNCYLGELIALSWTRASTLPIGDTPERIRRVNCIVGDEGVPTPDSKPWAIRFLWIKVTVSYYQRFRITLMQFTKQPFQRSLLCFRSGVTRSLAVTGKTSYICNTNRMSVMILAMRTDLRLRSTPFNSAVGRNNIMISTTLPAQRAVVAVNVRHSQCAASAVSAAMHNNQSYRSHTQMVL